MRFPDPVAVTCLTCGQPAVMAETPLGAVRVHCGTWRWQCDTAGTSTGHTVTPIGQTALGAAGDQELAA